MAIKKRNIYLEIDKEIVTALSRILDTQERTINSLMKMHDRVALLEARVRTNAKRRSK